MASIVNAVRDAVAYDVWRERRYYLNSNKVNGYAGHAFKKVPKGFMKTAGWA
jgi:hypothetical protein